MRLFKIAGLSFDEKTFGEMGEGEKSTAIDILIQNADMFYQANGKLTFADWEELNSIERTAFLLALNKSAIENLKKQNDIKEFGLLDSFVRGLVKEEVKI